MKIIQREIVKAVPGKRAEVLELLKKLTAIESSLGAPPARSLRCISGRSERMHTIILEVEWDSFTQMETVVEKMYSDQEFQELMAKWEPIVESQEIEFYRAI